MKKIVSVVVCVLLLVSAVSFSAFAKSEATETTEFVLEIDVNKRYTDIVDDTSVSENEYGTEKGINKPVYIGVLVAALVVSVVILAVSLKKVPKEEDIDISGNNKIKKDKEE